MRKGRNSVEEIIIESIATTVGTDVTNLKMHGCGREDIDVRMLGNGRPFVVECLNLRSGLTSELLHSALLRIQSGLGLNGNFDVEATWLSEVPKRVWEGMQTVAEEKCKGYICVVRMLELHTFLLYNVIKLLFLFVNRYGAISL